MNALAISTQMGYESEVFFRSVYPQTYDALAEKPLPVPDWNFMSRPTDFG